MPSRRRTRRRPRASRRPSSSARSPPKCAPRPPRSSGLPPAAWALARADTVRDDMAVPSLRAIVLRAQEPQYTSSRIISGVQQLDISGGAAQHMGGREAASLAAAPAASAGAGMAAPAQRGGEASAARSGAPASQAEPHAEEEEEGAEGEEGEGDGGWERACSRNARVRKLKKETRKAAWEARRAQEARARPPVSATSFYCSGPLQASGASEAFVPTASHVLSPGRRRRPPRGPPRRRKARRSARRRRRRRSATRRGTSRGTSRRTRGASPASCSSPPTSPCRRAPPLLGSIASTDGHAVRIFFERLHVLED